jgi:hypothetical protein
MRGQAKSGRGRIAAPPGCEAIHSFGGPSTASTIARSVIDSAGRAST